MTAATPTSMPPLDHRLWVLAQPYLQVRRNADHTWYSYHFARTLAGLHPESQADVVGPAMLLHDIGWSVVPPEKILESFGPRTRYPELRRLHETEGARLAGELLDAVNHPSDRRAAILAIIDGHDTRADAASIEDAIVRDADKLWRYTPFGLEVVCEWFGHDVPTQIALLASWTEGRFFTAAGRHMALGLLAALRASHGEPVSPEI